MDIQSITELPPEIQGYIASELPNKSLSALACVSLHFNSIVQKERQIAPKRALSGYVGRACTHDLSDAELHWEFDQLSRHFKLSPSLPLAARCDQLKGLLDAKPHGIVGVESLEDYRPVRTLHLMYTDLVCLSPSLLLRVECLRELSFTDCRSLSHLPQALTRCQNLRRFALQGVSESFDIDSVQCLPDSLHALMLTRINLPEVPERMFELTELRHLYLIDVKLKQLPSKPWKLPKLEALILVGNRDLRASTFDFSQFPSLRVLDTAFSGWESTFHGLASLTQLKYVNLVSSLLDLRLSMKWNSLSPDPRLDFVQAQLAFHVWPDVRELTPLKDGEYSELLQLFRRVTQNGGHTGTVTAGVFAGPFL